MTPRSYTLFAGRDDLSHSGSKTLKKLADVSLALTEAYGVPRTIRVTLPTIHIDSSEDFAMDLAMASRWYELALKHGIRWVNQPFEFSSAGAVEESFLNLITNFISKHDRMFASLNDRTYPAVDKASSSYAKICKALSRHDHMGFSNFRFGVGFNITPYTPFFPFSVGGETGFSVALESLPLIREEWERSASFPDIVQTLTENLQQAAGLFEQIAGQFDCQYHGADWSLAPLPNGKETVVGFIETVSGNLIGSGGALSAVARLTQCLKAPMAEPAGLKGTGFNGVMLSVLEDDVLASRFSHRNVSVNDLLLYSSVCGCGLDMVPVSGDTSEDAIAEFASDTAHLAFRLNKPLGVRFLPISRLREGQKTTFSHDFVNNSAVVRL